MSVGLEDNSVCTERSSAVLQVKRNFFATRGEDATLFVVEFIFTWADRACYVCSDGKSNVTADFLRRSPLS
jgi:hypothetical protein